MTDQLINYNSALSNMDDNALREKIQNFQKILHREPPKDEIKVNKLKSIRNDFNIHRG